MDDQPGPVSSTTDDGIPLRSLVRRGGGSPALSGSSMNRKTSRNNLLGVGSSRIRKQSSRSKLKDSDEEASQSLLHGRQARRIDGRATLLGEGEQDGEYDTGWKNQEEEEQALLLEEGRVLVSILKEFASTPAANAPDGGSSHPPYNKNAGWHRAL